MKSRSSDGLAGRSLLKQSVQTVLVFVETEGCATVKFDQIVPLLPLPRLVEYTDCSILSCLCYSDLYSILDSSSSSLAFKYNK